MRSLTWKPSDFLWQVEFIFLALSISHTVKVVDWDLHTVTWCFLSSRFPEREGRHSVPGSENSTAAAGRSTPGGPSASGSTSGSSGRTSQNQPSIPPLAFQFHQHNHQHQHTHTHQHFTPFLHPTATGPPLVRTSQQSRSPSSPTACVC